MIRLALFCGLMLSLAGTAMADEKDVPKELAPFQGTWKVVKAEYGGMAAKEPVRDDVRFTFKGDKLTVKEGKKDGAASCTVDAKKDPAEITLVHPKGETVSGIYKFDKDGKLYLCFPKGEKDVRPKSFDTKDTTNGLLVLEKVKE